MEEPLFFEKRIDFDEYSVLLRSWSLSYIKRYENGEERIYPLPTGAIACFFEDGITKISYMDRFMSKMYFEHCAPSDLKGLFDFIAKGYDLGEILKIKPLILWE